MKVMSESKESYIFGYSKDDGNDWHKIDAYGSNEIDSIEDPEGGSEIFLPTAIPSPFARIDLVKTAIENITQTPELKAYDSDKSEGKTVAGRNDERLVSHCLDMAELLFNADSFKGELEIITWDVRAAIEELKNGTAGHRELGETLEVFLKQDAATYNFDDMDYFFLVKYQHQIIGCTSPVTLFFTTANDLSRIDIRLTTNKKLFDQNYQSLYERDPDFQRYIYSFFQANSKLTSQMQSLSIYLENNLKILATMNPALHDELNSLDEEHFAANYSELDTGRKGENVMVLGKTLGKRKVENLQKVAGLSDFVVHSEKYTGKEKPLVLQNYLNKKLNYLNDEWDNTVQVPYVDNDSLENRKLPGLGVKYPYLTVSDFLEPYLMRLPYPMDTTRYFNGNLVRETGSDDYDYVLPLTEQFFEFFTTEQLLGGGKGNPTIELTQGAAGSVNVRLDIPIKEGKESITFERTYYDHGLIELTDPTISGTENKGVVLEHRFSIALFPFIKVDQENIPEHYRIQLTDQDKYGLFRKSTYRLDFFNENAERGTHVRCKAEKSRLNKQVDEASTIYYVLDKTFDFIQVSHDAGIKGILIPKWKKYLQGSKQFHFAVDFGTTNTHIEYTINGTKESAFDMTIDNSQVATLFHPTEAPPILLATGLEKLSQVLRSEFVPPVIGAGAEKFPIRTVIAEGIRIDLSQENFTLSDFNIPIAYEKDILSFNELSITTNLKWANSQSGNQERVKRFLDEVLFLLRNKVIMEGGNLNSTKITWLFPTSMSSGRQSKLTGLWQELVGHYFGEDNGVTMKRIAESLPPFLYLKKWNTGAGAHKPVTCIDIGGGTTDIAIFVENIPECVTSLKFGANTLFGDGYEQSGAASANGLIRKYLPHFNQLFLSNSQLVFLKEVLDEILQTNFSRDVNAFLFSLEEHPLVLDRKKFSFNALLGHDDDVKVVFLYYYAAITYHVAELMKQRGFDFPSHILFNGTGSKILDIISIDEKQLERFSQLVFNKVYGVEADKPMNISREKKSPKEITCKGTLHKDFDKLVARPLEEILMVHNGFDKGEKISHRRISNDPSIRERVVKQVTQFNAFFKDLNEDYSFAKNFEVSGEAMNLFFERMNESLENYFSEGIEFSRKLDDLNSDDNSELEESLFFLPLIGVIHQSMNDLAALTPLTV